MSDCVDWVERNKVKNDRYLKELELIQRCIDRTANNSFKIKRWVAVLLVLSLGLFSGADIRIVPVAGLLTGIVTVMLMVMDTYYLALEKIYRKRYEHVVKQGQQEQTFKRYCDDQINDMFDLNPRKINQNGDIVATGCDVNCISEFMRQASKSKVIWPFYSVSVAIVIIITVYAGLI